MSGNFLRRLLKFGLIAVGLILVSLVIGMAGYHLFEGLSWVDAFLNAAMLMGGMGPVNSLQTDAGKIFAGVYALYCGMVLLIAVAIFAVPILQRFLHHFHLESEKKQDPSQTLHGYLCQFFCFGSVGLVSTQEAH